MPVFVTKIQEFRAGHDLAWEPGQMGEALAHLAPGQEVIVRVEAAPPLPEGVTRKRLLEHLNGADVCPFCGSSDIESEHIIGDRDAQVQCQACGKRWVEEYSLTSIREIKE